MKSTDIKLQLSNALLELCIEKPLVKITVADLMERTGVSRYQFYKQFYDTNDLIIYTYRTHVIDPSWTGFIDTPDEYYLACLASSKRAMRNRAFCIAAYEMDGQNCLREHLIESYKEKDQKALEALGVHTDNPQVQYYLTYRAYGDFYTRYHWLKKELDATPEEMARYHTQSRYTMFEHLTGNVTER